MPGAVAFLVEPSARSVLPISLLWMRQRNSGVRCERRNDVFGASVAAGSYDARDLL
jgi:hypothetical protein